MAYCKRYNLVLIRLFSNVAKSGGSTDNRDQFNAMIDAIKNEANQPPSSSGPGRGLFKAKTGVRKSPRGHRNRRNVVFLVKLQPPLGDIIRISTGAQKPPQCGFSLKLESPLGDNIRISTGAHQPPQGGFSFLSRSPARPLLKSASALLGLVTGAGFDKRSWGM